MRLAYAVGQLGTTVDIISVSGSVCSSREQ